MEIASKGGAPQRLGWYRYLLAGPEVEVQVGIAKIKARARTVTGGERARLWEEALKFWRPYADYRARPSARSRSSRSTPSADTCRHCPGLAAALSAVPITTREGRAGTFAAEKAADKGHCGDVVVT